MDHPITKRRCAYQPVLGIVDIEGVVRAGPVGSACQILLQFKQLVGQLVFKPGRSLFAPFTPRRLLIGQTQIIPATDCLVHIIHFYKSRFPRICQSGESKRKF
jgi:hypothetical protein